MIYYLITSMFPDFQEHNIVLHSRIKYRPETIKEILLEHFNFFESASCEVSFISQYEAKIIGIKAPCIGVINHVLPVFENLDIYQKNRKQ